MVIMTIKWDYNRIMCRFIFLLTMEKYHISIYAQATKKRYVAYV